MTKQRIAWIDMAKGLAMLMIFFSHSDLKFHAFQLNHFLTSTHLFIFFILSGYTMMPRQLTLSSVNEKFKRLMIPYFITTFIMSLIDIINLIVAQQATILQVTQSFSKNIIRGFFASGAVTHFGPVDVGSRIGALWFLPALFFASILAQWYINHYKKNILFPVLLLSAMSIAYISSHYLWLPFSLQSGIYASGFLVIGYLLKEKNIIQNLSITHLLFCLFCYISATYFHMTKGYFADLNFNDALINAFVGIFGTIMFLKITQYLEKYTFPRRILSFIGQQSLLFLSLHIIELETLRFYLYRILKNSHLQTLTDLSITLMICVIILAILFMMSHHKNTSVLVDNEQTKRNKQIDMYKGLLILLMLLGHSVVDQTFRYMVYSFHMPAFIFISGYFYKPSQRPLIHQFAKLTKNFLIPYLIFSILYILLHYPEQSLDYMIGNLTMGMSFSKNILTEFQSVGPIYFVLLLFLVRILFIIINKITVNIYYQLLLCFILSLVGFYLGQNGLWLPWSLDIALYTMLIYALGYAFKYHDLLITIYNNLWLYFISSTIWAYAVFKSGIELAIRHYNTFTIGIIGSISGIITVAVFIQLIHLSKRYTFKNILATIGTYSLDILLLHTLTDHLFRETFAQFLNQNYIYFYLLNIGTQITIAVILSITFRQLLPNLFKKYL